MRRSTNGSSVRWSALSKPQLEDVTLRKIAILLGGRRGGRCLTGRSSTLQVSKASASQHDHRRAAYHFLRQQDEPLSVIHRLYYAERECTRASLFRRQEYTLSSHY